ncbi:MAG: O-antigen ligase family protein [Bacteroidales bacterium]
MIKFLTRYNPQLFLGFLVLMFISLPLSRFGLSVAQFGLLGVWLIDGKLMTKFRTLFKNKAALVLISFYLVHVIGLMYTTDLNYAFKDLRIKLPLLFLPVVFVTSPQLSMKRVNQLLMIYVASVFVATLISFGILLTRTISDFRELSPFISHIRFSLNVCIAMFFTGYLMVFELKSKISLKLLAGAVIIWFFVFLIMIESVTGIIIFFITGSILMLGFIVRMKIFYCKLIGLIVLISIPVILAIYLNITAKNYFIPREKSNPELFTRQGNPYYHDTINQPIENGMYTWMYVCEMELREMWNNKSKLDYDGKDTQGQDLKYTLIRYLNSKGLRKDAGGMKQLSEKDIKNIELGIANYHYTRKFNVNSRLYKLFWEYQISKMKGNPGGHSMLQRIEFWRASWAIILDNFWIGVGTGDIDQAYKIYY